MKLGIMQPYFFPYIGTFQLLNYVDTYVLYDDVNFIKDGWIQRNNILINGKASLITLSLLDKSSYKKINEIEIDDNPNNRQKIVDSIYFAYKKAPMFNLVMPTIEKAISDSEKNLSLYLINSYKQICEYLDITTNIIKSSDIDKNENLKGQDKVIEICHTLHAQKYVNAIGGKELYDKKIFSREGIEVGFLQTDAVHYKQFNNKFITNLSIIDVLMFNSQPDIKSMLTKFILV